MKKFLSILLATLAGSACTKTPEAYPIHRLTTGSGEDGFFKKAFFSPNNAMRVKSHPESGCVFKGMKLPDYEKGLALCLRAHALLPRLKSIGWDVAFTPQGQILIEGNDDWEISLAQMVN